MVDIFISYSRKDFAVMEVISTKLEKLGFSIWYDRGTSAGEEWASRIESQLRSADAVLVIWTEDAINSSFVKEEARLAKELKKLVQIKLGAQTAIPFGFGEVHYEDFESWNKRVDHSSFLMLLEALRRTEAKKSFDNTRMGTSVARKLDALREDLRSWVGVSLAPEDVRLIAKRQYLTHNPNGLFARIAERKIQETLYRDAADFARSLGEQSSHALHAKDADTLHFLAVNLDFGNDGTTKDPVGAAKLYRLAASFGSSEAAWNLALCYRDGDGVPQSESESMVWFRQCAEAGNDRAMFILASAYLDGRGVAKNVELGIQYLKEACAAKNPDALLTIGLCHEDGHGVEKSITKASSFLAAAEAAGNNNAVYHIGRLYENGSLKDPNAKARAKYYFKQAIDLGDLRGALKLAEMAEATSPSLARDLFRRALTSELSWVRDAAQNGLNRLVSRA